MADFASEFTPEINDKYLASLLNPIDEEQRRAEGRARMEGEAGGLIGKFSSGGKIGAAREGAARAKSDTISKFNWDVAGLRRGERLTGEGRAYESEEAKKQREFQEMLAQQGYTAEAARQRHEDIKGQQGLIAGGLMSAFSSGVGGLAGSAL